METEEEKDHSKIKQNSCTYVVIHFKNKKPDVRDVTSDKLLLTMLIGTPPLQDLNPDTLQASSLQDQLPGCLQIFGLEPEQDLTLGNPLKLDEPKPPTLTLPTLKVTVNPTNQWAGQAIDPKITWATTEGETKKLPIENRPPRDD
ncbi:hypothetical protein DSO57_1028598 [Entomophthora muscae]|uniref:Uncharacterized protein n=1 Tax=Entomophthora muscae TaxID=34485 RepID=A0ACC2TN90_9FUNG|nr:hypothetical protein DSO57_1028598 [Entomophthora muscae]